MLGDSALAGFPLMDSQQVNAEVQESIVLPPQHRHVMHAPHAPQCIGPAPLPQGVALQNASLPAESHTRDSGAPVSPAAAAPGAFPLMNSQQVCEVQDDDSAAPPDTGVHALHSGAAAAVDAQQVPAGPRLDNSSRQRLFQRQGSAAAMLGRHASGRGVSGILATVTGMHELHARNFRMIQVLYPFMRNLQQHYGWELFTVCGVQEHQADSDSLQFERYRG